MLCIIGGIIIACAIFWLLGEFVIDETLMTPLIVLMVFVFGFGIIWGLFGEPIGYKEPVLVDEIELVSLNNTVSSEGGGNMFYVSVSANNVYTYRYEVKDKYNLGGKSYEMATLSDNVTEVESKECKKPVLKVYEKKPKRSWITFAFGSSSKVEYVFYVPEGTIKKQVVLK